MEKQLRLWKILSNASMAMLLSFGLMSSVSAQRGAGVVNCHGRLQVKNAHVCSESGTQISLGGMSFFWSNWAESYYTASTVDYLVDQFKVSLVRAAYGVPESSGPNGKYGPIEAVVNQAIARNIYVIIDWHTEGNAWNYHQQAKDFFTYMAQKYGNYPHVIYELWNEPTSQSASSIRDWCQDIANTIRRYDPDNLVICGSGTWSQYPNSYSISDPNAAYTFHGYFDDPANGAAHRSQFYTNVNAAMNMGNAVFVTEFGSHYNSNSGTAEIIGACQTMGISMAAWSVNDKAEPWSIFNGFMGSLTDIGNFYKSKLTTWSTAACGGGPSTCTVVNVPAKIEAESYCDSYGVQKETCSEGGQNIGYIDAGDWMSYKINVPATGNYIVKYRVASMSGGGSIKLEAQGGSTTYGTIAVPSTGGWQTWTTIQHTVTLPAGEQSVAIAAPVGGWNVNWIDISSSTSGVTLQIEAENYTVMSGVQKETCSEGGQNVGYIDAGDWMSYESGISLPAGTYTVEYRVASLNGGGTIKLERSGGAATFGTIGVPATGGWQTWTTISHSITISQTETKIGIAVPAGGYNINWIKFTSTSLKSANENESAISEGNELSIYPNPAGDYLNISTSELNIGSQLDIYDISGKMIRSEIITDTNMMLDLSQVNPGVYFVKVNGSVKQLLKR